MNRKKYSIFSKEKIGAFVLLVVVAVLIGMVIGSCGKSEETLAECWAMCKPGSRVTVRREPSKKAAEAGYLECGDSFRTDGVSVDGWIRCYGAGEGGWVYSGYVVTEKPKMVMERYICCAVKQVACRKWMAGPQIEGKPWLKHGQNVTVFCMADGWAVTSRGYIKSEWLEADPE